MATETTLLQSMQQEIITIKQLLVVSKNVLTLNDVSLYTGLAKSYLYKLTMNGILPHSKPNGKTIFVERAELDKWLLSQKRATNEQIDIAAATYISTNKGKGGLTK